MTSDQVREAVLRYEIQLLGSGATSSQFSVFAAHPSIQEGLNHALWMCSIIRTQLDEGKLDKAVRWLCFVQAVIWMGGLGPINDFRRDNAASGG